MNRLKAFKIDFIFCIIISLGIVYILYFHWVYPIGDEPYLLLLGRTFLHNPKLIFSFDVCNAKSQFYRPVERFIWLSNYGLFKTNPIPLQIFKRILCLGVLINVYIITKFLTGRISGGIACFLMLSSPVTRRFIEVLYVPRTIGIYLFTLFIYLLLLWIEKKRIWQLILSYIFLTLAVFSIESFAIIFLFLGLALLIYLRGKERRVFSISYVIFLGFFLLFSLIYFFQAREFLFRYFFGNYGQDFSIFNRIVDNFHYYFIDVLSKKFFILTMFSVIFSLLFFKSSVHNIFLVWGFFSFLPLLILPYHPYHYFLESFFGFIIFIAMSIALLIQRALLLWQNIYHLKLTQQLKASVIFLSILAMSICIILDVPQNFNKIQDFKNWTAESYTIRRDGVNKLFSLPVNSKIYISNIFAGVAGLYYQSWLDLYNITDITVFIVTPSDIENFTGSENLLQNYTFDKNMICWVIPQTGGVHIDCDLTYDRYGICIKKYKGKDIDYIGPFQIVEVDPNYEYIFGGWMKIKNFQKLAHFEIQEIPLKNNSLTFALGGLEGSSKWNFFCSRFKPSKNCKRVKFIAGRIPTYLHGEVWIDNVFMYKLKPHITFLDYNF